MMMKLEKRSMYKHDAFKTPLFVFSVKFYRIEKSVMLLYAPPDFTLKLIYLYFLIRFWGDTKVKEEYEGPIG